MLPPMPETASIESSAPGAPRRAHVLQDGITIAWAIAAAVFILHVYFNNRYGYFRNKFNYMSCGDNLQWGYVDQPPLVPFLILVSRALLGKTQHTIRFM